MFVFKPNVLLLAGLSVLNLSTAAWTQSAAAEAQKVESPAKAASEPNRLETVRVQGSASDEMQRRAATAARIVIGREEIERFGDASAAELLKRLPGVTLGGRPGRGGEPRMRGMGGGYTQILVNGERMPPGFSLEQIPPEQIERIEVMRAPTAEFGARAIAGTINIVLREALQRRLNELRLGLGMEQDLYSPQLSWQRNDRVGETGTYTFNLNGQVQLRLDEIDTLNLTRWTPSGEQRQIVQRGQSDSTQRSLHFGGRVQWRLGEGNTLALQSFAAFNRNRSGTDLTQQISRSALAPAPSNFDEAHTQGSNDFDMLRLGLQWNHKLGADTRLELRAGGGNAQSRSDSLRRELLLAQTTRTQQDNSEGRNRSWNLSSKLSHQLGDDHSLVAGAEAEGNRSTQQRSCLQNGLDCSALADYGDNPTAGTQRLAAYAQDEWTWGPKWAFYAGLRWEQISTHSDRAAQQLRQSSAVTTPLLHALYKIDERSKEQLRASLTRSYRSPNLQDLIAQPSINNQFPCVNAASCGANEYAYPDRMGNPELRPELATGLELAYEKYLSKGGVLSANVFARRITDLIRTTPQLESVSWAAVPRWVNKPRNIGQARTYGVELEAKFRLDEFLEDALPVNIRSNLSLYRSRVEGIPGPHNTLDQQPGYTANLGADYRLRSLPLSLGASLNLTPRQVIQQSIERRAESDAKRVLDAYATWTFNSALMLRLSASNVLAQDHGSSSYTLAPGMESWSRSQGRSYRAMQLRLEWKV
ncbi:TonB-dependent receptor plug domain-containing protein [Roseateles sp. BYS180W]|uniref:TonB-dependent receptor plug domain-containing protein n=1 Tax=Roseateles rivi TaxID=3299028 RepID=A0ABW7FRY4_9BURK